MFLEINIFLSITKNGDQYINDTVKYYIGICKGVFFLTTIKWQFGNYRLNLILSNNQCSRRMLFLSINIIDDHPTPLSYMFWKRFYEQKLIIIICKNNPKHTYINVNNVMCCLCSVWESTGQLQKFCSNKKEHGSLIPSV